jgi:hypothetical protein
MEIDLFTVAVPIVAIVALLLVSVRPIQHVAVKATTQSMVCLEKKT